MLETWSTRPPGVPTYKEMKWLKKMGGGGCKMGSQLNNRTLKKKKKKQKKKTKTKKKREQKNWLIKFIALYQIET